MKVTSIYSVFGFDDVNVGLKIYVDFYGCKVLHHPNIPGLNYYVVEDASGNRTDLVSGNNIKKGDHWVRINVDKLDEALAFFGKYGAILEGNIIDGESSRIALVKAGDANIKCVIFEHKSNK